MKNWNTEDYTLVRQAREGAAPVLEDLNPLYLPQRTPTIEIVCSDWTKRYEMVTHLAQMRGYERYEDPQVHLLAWHGGPIRLFARSPANENGDHGTFTRELLEAVELTGILDVNLHGHWPCKKCLKHKMGVKDAWQSILPHDLQKLLPGAHFRTIFHVDYEEHTPHGMKNYRIHPGRCAEFIATAA